MDEAGTSQTVTAEPSAASAAVGSAAAGGASPFAAAPPPRTSLEAAAADAATSDAASTQPAEAAVPIVQMPASSSSFALADADSVADAAADHATAQLPPRPSVSRNDSLARVGSFVLRPLPHTNIAIYGWGRNDCGQLGFSPDQGSECCHRCLNGSSSSCLPPGPPGIIAAVSRLKLLEGRLVVAAAASLFNTAFLTADGELYMLGSNDSGLLGHRPKPADAAAAAADGATATDYSWSPVRLEALEPYPLADVALGQEHALAVTQQGVLASWGSNECGQLGTGATSEKPQHTPKLLRGLAAATTGCRSRNSSSPVPGSSSGSSNSARMAFVRCAVGAANSLALSSSGRCFTFGQGTHGVLGVGGCAASPVPVHVAGLWEVGVLQVTAGEAHCGALGANGCVYTWGRGKYGQLGHGNFEDQDAPKQITSVSHVHSIAAGDHHTLLLAAKPNSNNNSSSSSIADHSTSAVQVYAFGRGTFGATGLGSTDNVCRPSRVTALEGKRVVQVAAGRQHSVALTASGQIYTWGDGQLGQLGLGCSCSSSSSNSSSSSSSSAGRWQLPRAQVSPKCIQQLPWPTGCCVLFVAAGGDHNIAVVQLQQDRSSSKRRAAAAAAEAGRSSLDIIAEQVAAEMEQQATAEPMQVEEQQQQQQQQQQQAESATAMQVDKVTPWQQQQQEQCAAIPSLSGPDPSQRPYGSSFIPVQPPPLLQLATAAAAEAAAARRAAGMISPEPGSSSSSMIDSHPAGPEAARAAAAAARDDHARAASIHARPSPVVVDLAHAVLDVFSSPGLLLLLFKADNSNTKHLSGAGLALQQPVPDHGLDLDQIEAVYTLLLKSYAREVVAALGAACVRLLQELPETAVWSSGSSSREVVALLFILLQNPLNSDVHGLGSVLLGLLTAIVLKLNASSMRLLQCWLAELKPEVFGARVVRPVQALLTRLAREAVQAAVPPSGLPPGVRLARPGFGGARGDVLLLARLLDVLHGANVQAGELVPCSEFANGAVSGTASLAEEYFTWLQEGAYRSQYEAFQKAAAQATSAKAAIQAAATAAEAFSRSNHATAAQHDQHAHLRQQQQLLSDVSERRSAAAAAPVPAGVPGGLISSLCEVPFLLTTEAKSNILRDEATLQQQHVVHASAMAAILQGLPPGGLAAAAAAGQQRAGSAAAAAGDPLALTLNLRIRRGHVMKDALTQIRNCGPQELKKPLRVTFLSEDGSVPEEGVDQGGVSREFFQLLVGQLFSPDYGMFVYVQESRSCWFNTATLESLDEFELVGIVLGLACYNGIILDAHLPLVAYKKLMGRVPTFADVAHLYPSLHSGLQQLLDFEGDVETTFCRNFEVEYEAFGQTQAVELLPGGSSIAVTAANRDHFVALYTAWLLTNSVAEQFAAFASGFHRVCGGPALSLFRYEEVELLVEGLPHLDFKELQAGARYEAGYSAHHPTITALWSVLHALPIDEKRAFLQFCTGCDRAPIAGLAALHLLIQRGGPDSDKLPTAHTCFNTLLLPEYSSKAKLQQKLMTAIQNAQGFGLQ